jgi:glycosyltransferase involved in cell wall biosynthesis
MRVVVDIQAGVAQRAGVGRYTKALVQHLGPLAGRDELDLFYFDFQRKGEPFPVEGARRKAVRWCPGRIAQKAWKTVHWPPFDWFAGSADIYHFPNFIRPPLSGGKSVVTIHDIAFLRYPETIEERNLRYLTAQIRRTLDQSDAVITVSQFTAHELQEVLGIPRDRIFPIHNGLTDDMQRPDRAAVAAVRKEFGLERPYLLTVGTIEPRKNIEFLVRVFEELKSFDGDLVIAGRCGWKYEPILARMHGSMRAARIRHIDTFGEEHLPALYAGAEIFLFPSMYEGFGFPPLEAMACGTPVAAARTASLPEVLGDAADLVEEFDVGLWGFVISKVLGDRTRRAELVAKGLARAKRFTWEETARRTWEVYRTTASGCPALGTWHSSLT